MRMAIFRRNEHGLTLIEMMVALLVFSFVMAGALAFLRAQGRSFVLGSERVAMLQNSRFALDELEKDLRTAGAGTPDIQPPLVYLGSSVVAFNANYLSTVPGDVFAVYHNPDADSAGAVAVRMANRFTIPTTSVVYPDTDYDVGGVDSPAETITFFFAPDTSTTRGDDFALYRQVNDLAPELVSRNILRTPGVPFFQYDRLTLSSGAPAIQPVDNATLPWRHTVPIHLAAADTGAAARIDSVRAVRVDFTVTNGLLGAAERRRSLDRTIRLPNVGLANRRTCGDKPIQGGTFTAAWDSAAGGVDLQWTAAVDELGGERDVVRYVIWRRLATDSAWGAPYFSLAPTATPTYTYADQSVTAGARYVYGLAAQDCTPTTSDVIATAPVDIPIP